MYSEFKSFQGQQPILKLTGVALLLTAVVARLVLMPNVIGDFRVYVDPWAQFIVDHGGLPAFRHNFADYTPAYLYWLLFAVTGLSWLPRIFAIKLFAAATDFLLAYYVYRLVSFRYPSSYAGSIAGLVALFLPTVLLNGSYWGQCDVVYTTCLLACLYHLCLERWFLAVLWFSVAISFKLQAIFLAPLLLLLVLQKRIKWQLLLLVPSVYFATILPALWVGRPLKDLLLIYLNQSKYYKDLSSNAPNFYIWISKAWFSIGVRIGVGFTAALILCGVWYILRNRAHLSRERLVELAALSSLVLPYCLPKMHDRYFFFADVLTLILAFYVPKFFWIPFVLQFASLSSYFRYFVLDKGYNIDLLPLVKYSSLPMGIAAICLCWYCLNVLQPKLTNESVDIGNN
jgi:Gpi18-like mannosyltransferase